VAMMLSLLGVACRTNGRHCPRCLLAQAWMYSSYAGLTLSQQKLPARTIARAQSEHGTSEGYWRRLQCEVRRGFSERVPEDDQCASAPVVTPAWHAETALPLCSPVSSGSTGPRRCGMLAPIRCLLYWDSYAR